MDREFWLERWQQNLIGFHQQEINPHLQQQWPKLAVPAGGQVLVPLCGKSRDMCWLSEHGHPVLGVELSPRAVEDFFRETGQQVDRRPEPPFDCYAADRFKLLCGDFFDLSPEQVGQVRAVYDRASLIALPPAMRARFAEHLTSVLPAPVEMLLVTLEYPQEQMDGPPFAVTEQEIHLLFAAQWTIERLGEQDILATESKFRERGLTRLVETSYRLCRRPA